MGTLSGLAIAFTIRSVDRSLFSRLVDSEIAPTMGHIAI